MTLLNTWLHTPCLVPQITVCRCNSRLINNMTPLKAQSDDRPEKFPWDFDDPNTPFWNDPALKSPLSRNFLTCFTAQEVTDMNLDASAHLIKDKKLSLLLHLLQSKYEARKAEVAPSPLYETAWEDWQRLMVGFIHLQDLSGLGEEQQNSLELLMKHGRDGKRNLVGVNMMASFKMDQGKYDDAELLVREALPWLQEHEMLGRDSPQALGCMRRLIECLWKQGKIDEADKVLGEYRTLVTDMGNGKFEKYQDEEKEEMETLLPKAPALMCVGQSDG
ncbi:hypothetical protein N0V93_007083 [Gnomoniopsis smithogilvyi]|uniref:Uncharacterized protein n=1 Tax=Gnomoniopsis smithogilvyi TaxID=1191159 RepID=A0A9W8YQW2_9PEZI|nr:hypothetical protein N0V93_007083 [Gnomoniopsis smithogilvyi]